MVSGSMLAGRDEAAYSLVGLPLSRSVLGDGAMEIPFSERCYVSCISPFESISRPGLEKLADLHKATQHARGTAGKEAWRVLLELWK